MKSKYIIFRTLFLLLAFFLVSATIIAQPVPPEGNAGSMGPMGGAAPLGGGLVSLWVLLPLYILKNKIRLFIGHKLIKYLP